MIEGWTVSIAGHLTWWTLLPVRRHAKPCTNNVTALFRYLQLQMVDGHCFTEVPVVTNCNFHVLVGSDRAEHLATKELESAALTPLTHSTSAQKICKGSSKGG